MNLQTKIDNNKPQVHKKKHQGIIGYLSLECYYKDICLKGDGWYFINSLQNNTRYSRSNIRTFYHSKFKKDFRL